MSNRVGVALSLAMLTVGCSFGGHHHGGGDAGTTGPLTLAPLSSLQTVATAESAQGSQPGMISMRGKPVGTVARVSSWTAARSSSA